MACFTTPQSGRAEEVMELATRRHLPGAHNWQNAALAYAATKRLVNDARAIAAAIASFPGLAHRIEDVGRAGKVRFINDSKATNADAAERALACFPDIFWIAGGKPKEGGIESLAPHFPPHPQGLSHRRGGERISRPRWRARCPMTSRARSTAR